MAKSVAQAKKEIEKLQLELEKEIDVSNEVKYTDEEIERLLKKLPVAMFKAAQTIVLRHMDYKEAKRLQKKEMAKQWMKAKANSKLTAAGDRKAWAGNTKEVERAEIAVVTAEAEWKIAELRYDALENLYMAIKKMVIMRTQQSEAEDRYSRARINK